MITKLREILLNKNIKQRELGKALNISEGTISKYCKGTSEPDIQTLSDIANYLHVSIDEIVIGSSDSLKMREDDLKMIRYHESEIQKIVDKYLDK